jgi:predicted enzyme involved in methoxymalonyl-ACP biosynthesis
MIKAVLIDLDRTFWNFDSWAGNEKTLQQLQLGLYPESLECIDLLKKKGYLVGFASASYKKELCEKYIDMLFPPKYLDFVYIEATYPSKKNHFNYVSTKFDVEFGDMILIDDLKAILNDAVKNGLNIVDVSTTGISKEKIKHLL